MQERARALTLIARILATLLAIVFLTTGISKFFGADPLGLQAAAMRGFPTWIRVISGIVEVAAAIALFFPKTITPAACVLALLMIPAFFTQQVSGQRGLWVPPLLFSLLVFLAWAQAAAIVTERFRAMRARPHPILRDGVIAGIIGATCIAGWFLGVDVVAGHPFFTPVTLGRAFVRLFGPVPEGTSEYVYLGAYTLFHYAAFIVVGLIASLIVRVARREPSVLLGFVVLFVAFEVGFYALVSLLQQASPLGVLAWHQVMIGNLIASVAMGTYLVRAHPALREQFWHALDAR